MTPDISPAMPTSTKFCSGTNPGPPIRLIVLESTNPAIAPMKSVGPNVPPTPPPAFVKDIENTFKRSTRRKNTGTSQAFLRKNARTVCPSISMVPPFRSSCR